MTNTANAAVRKVRLVALDNSVDMTMSFGVKHSMRARLRDLRHCKLISDKFASALLLDVSLIDIWAIYLR